jgi:hypothetical protein
MKLMIFKFKNGFPWLIASLLLTGFMACQNDSDKLEKGSFLESNEQPGEKRVAIQNDTIDIDAALEKLMQDRVEPKWNRVTVYLDLIQPSSFHEIDLENGEFKMTVSCQSNSHTFTDFCPTYSYLPLKESFQVYFRANERDTTFVFDAVKNDKLRLGTLTK